MRSTSLHRQLDRRAGIPLIALASLFKRRRALPVEAKQIVVLQPTAIGDTLIASGIYSAVLARYPSADIHILHGSSNGAAVDMIDAPFSSRVIDFRRPEKVVVALRQLRPDLVIDLTPWSRLTALCTIASGAISVGYNSDGQKRGGAFDHPVSHRSDRHEIENARAMAAVFDPTRPYRPSVKPPTIPPSISLDFSRLVLFHTTCGGSRRLDRAWTASNWAELARLLGKDGYIIGFTGTKSEIEEIAPIERLAAKQAPTLLLAGRLTLQEFAYSVSSCCGLVSLDTGAVHIASSLNAIVVGLYGPAKAARWGPWSIKGIGVDSPHPEAGYSSFGFETSPYCRPTMEAITVDAVYAAFKSVGAPAAEARSSV